MEYDNTNRGSIWKNDRKEKDTQPDFTGSINVEGKEYWLNAWKRKDDANEKAPLLSFSVKAKDDQAQAKPMYAENSAGDVKQFDDNIPF